MRIYYYNGNGEGEVSIEASDQWIAIRVSEEDGGGKIMDLPTCEIDKIIQALQSIKK